MRLYHVRCTVGAILATAAYVINFNTPANIEDFNWGLTIRKMGGGGTNRAEENKRKIVQITVE
jgi:hypothetical protein